MSSETETLQVAAEKATARLITLMCIDSHSSTHGCVDREFWAYRTTRGFSSAPFQHVMSGLSHLSRTSGLPEAERFHLLAVAALDFWIANRNANGSANEWYRNEQSYCATSMGLHAATEALLQLRETMPHAEVAIRSEHLRESEQWLHKRRNPLASNQQIASCAGRFQLGVLLEDTIMMTRALQSLSEITDGFNRSGYLAEYGGIDLGYLLLSIDLLSPAHQVGFTACESLVETLCVQLRSLLSISGQLPFELGTRGSAHMFFGGVKYFSQHIPSVRTLYESMDFRSVDAQVESLHSYDDRYLTTFAYSALIRRLKWSTASANLVPSSHRISVASTTPISASRCIGGTLYVHKNFGHGLSWIGPNYQRLSHLGYVFTDRHGGRWTSLTPIDAGGESYHFVQVSEKRPLVTNEFLVRTLFALCKIPSVARAASWWARTRAGRPQRTTQMWLHREIVNQGDSVSVIDQIRYSGKQSGVISTIQQFPFHSPSLMTLAIGSLSAEMFTHRLESTAQHGQLEFHWKIASSAEVEVRKSIR